MTGHIYQPALCVISEKKFQALPPELKKILTTGWQSYREKSTKQIRKVTKQLAKNLEKAGIEVQYLSKEERAKFKKGTESIKEDFRKKTSDKGRLLLKKIEDYLKTKS